MTADITVYAESSGNNGCTPKLANWKPVTWTCTQMPQQDTSKNSYYMQVKFNSFYQPSFKLAINPIHLAWHLYWSQYYYHQPGWILQDGIDSIDVSEQVPASSGGFQEVIWCNLWFQHRDPCIEFSRWNLGEIIQEVYNFSNTNHDRRSASTMHPQERDPPTTKKLH